MLVHRYSLVFSTYQQRARGWMERRFFRGEELFSRRIRLFLMFLLLVPVVAYLLLHGPLLLPVSISSSLVTVRSFFVAKNIPPCGSVGLSRRKMLQSRVGKISLSVMSLRGHDSVPITISGSCCRSNKWKVCFLALALWQLTLIILSCRACAFSAFRFGVLRIACLGEEE